MKQDRQSRPADPEKKNQRRNKKAPGVLLAVLVFGVLTSTLVLGSLLGEKASREERDVIALTGTEVSDSSNAKEQETGSGTVKNRNAGTTTSSFFQAEDGQTVWSKETKVDIFRLSDENGEGVVTVQSENSDKVFAPGTENEYHFTLKNTGEGSVDYEMSVEAYFTPKTLSLPVEVRMKGYDGEYLTGGDESWESAESLNGIRDEAKLEENHYADYTLEWRWPFERGADELDTLLGNRAVGEDLTLTVVIKTTASKDTAPSGTYRKDNTTATKQESSAYTKGNGPKTGDETTTAPYIVLTAASLLVLSLLYLKKRKKRVISDERSQDR